jgi:serralysin
MCFVCFGASSISKKSSILHEPDVDGGKVIYGAIGVDEARGGAGGAFAMPFGWKTGSSTVGNGALVNVDEWIGFGGGNDRGGSVPIARDDSAIDGLSAPFLAVNVDEAVSMSAGSLPVLVDGEVIIVEADGTALPPGTIGQSSGSGGDTIAGSTATTATIATGQAVTGYANTATDSDWFRITLTAGQTYTFAAFGFGTTSLPDTELTLYNAVGGQLAYNDEAGQVHNSRLSFTASTTGTYYIAVTGYGSTTGQYLLTANAGSSVHYPTLSVQQIADQITHTYWQSNYGSAAKWGTTSISFNVQALEPERAVLARAAFAAWAEVCGLTFTEVTSGGNITLDDEVTNSAYANFSTSGGFITSATINIAKNWYNGIDTLDSYTYQTYLHEIGHTLGFGHAGPYNGSATWGTDNSYANDIWQMSLMSYFDGTDPDPDLASYRFTMTPMLADIYAAQTYYGARTIRGTDTVYGHNSNAGSTYSFSTYSQAPSYTIWDSGGTDTLDASGYSANQTIDLTAGSLSSIGGLMNNVGIALGTVVENAKGGSGNDTFIGNAADNTLEGGAGNDTIYGGIGNDLARGGDGIDLIFGGAGNDTIGGKAGDDMIYGEEGDDSLWGDDGNDTLEGGPGNDYLRGVAGDDLLRGGAGNDHLAGGAGNDRLGGKDGDDFVSGGEGNDELWGDAGADTLHGGLGTDFLTGGIGSDTFLFDPSWGSDTIRGWENGVDRLDFSAMAVLNLHSAADLTISYVSGGVAISFGGNSITIANYSGPLDVGNWIFA